VSRSEGHESGPAPSELASTANDDDYLLDVPNADRLAIVFTLTCNIRCTHCLVRSGPERREKMTLEDAKRIVTAAARTGTKVIYLTGGEVFLFYRELLGLVAHVRAVGCQCVVETNAYWARSEAATLSRLLPLREAGLDCIGLSIDAYHEDEGGIDRSVRLAEVCHRLGIMCRVLVIASADPERDRTIVASLRAKNIPYFYDELMSIGRGSEIAAERDVLLQRERCDSIGLTVVPDGDLFSCFGATDENTLLKKTPLYVGNLLTEDPEMLFRKERDNPFSRTIDRDGHACLVSMLREKPDAHLPGWEDGTSICVFCQDLLSDEDNVVWLRDRLSAELR
jgi:MoaA/NifB/PqqE/SkfB family radical SAM enzyme